jgi:hypothetical protein
MRMAADPGVGVPARNLARDHEDLLQQAMAVPELVRAMEAYAALALYQAALAAALQQKITYATGGNAAVGVTPTAPAIPFGIGANP